MLSALQDSTQASAVLAIQIPRLVTAPREPLRRRESLNQSNLFFVGFLPEGGPSFFSDAALGDDLADDPPFFASGSCETKMNPPAMTMAITRAKMTKTNVLALSWNISTAGL
eukprot:TRINITY_DN84568_c0_g1_i1.p3 TRINITY_DN84568_c0_g1~~TRINITY_DN84568_c0_g1_i1.p3  ORF type:complete len:112 (-),score=13.06 TRINITY_DN84568_c0_g1_i1:71-406(-)